MNFRRFNKLKEKYNRCIDKNKKVIYDSPIIHCGMKKGGVSYLKVAFWSNTRGTCGVTSNLACISVISALQGKKKAILLENHFHLNNLEGILNQSLERNLVKEYTYYSQIGIDHLMRRIHSGMEMETAIADCSIPITEGLYYLPQNIQMNTEQFNYEFSRVVYPLLELLEKQGYVIYFDLEPGDTISSRIILNEADVIVVNLCQNPSILEDFFQQYGSLQKRAFYVVGSYSPESTTTISKIKKKYQIAEERLGVIPYSIILANAMNQGKLVPFLKSNFKEVKKLVNKSLWLENKRFMEEAKETTALFLRFCESSGGEI